MPIRAACNGFKGQNDIRNMSCYKKSDISNGESITDWQSLGVLATSETENIAERNRLGQQESQIYSWDQALTQLIQELLVRLPRLPKVQATKPNNAAHHRIEFETEGRNDFCPG